MERTNGGGRSYNIIISSEGGIAWHGVHDAKQDAYLLPALQAPMISTSKYSTYYITLFYASLRSCLL